MMDGYTFEHSNEALSKISGPFGAPSLLIGNDFWGHIPRGGARVMSGSEVVRLLDWWRRMCVGWYPRALSCEIVRKNRAHTYRKGINSRAPDSREMLMNPISQVFAYQAYRLENGLHEVPPRSMIHAFTVRVFTTAHLYDEGKADSPMRTGQSYLLREFPVAYGYTREHLEEVLVRILIGPQKSGVGWGPLMSELSAMRMKLCGGPHPKAMTTFEDDGSKDLRIEVSALLSGAVRMVLEGSPEISPEFYGQEQGE